MAELEIRSKMISELTARTYMFSLFFALLKCVSPHTVQLSFTKHQQLTIKCTFATRHRIILVEGNYLYLDLPEWHEVASLLDERWFIQADEDVAMERVVKRHMGTGNDESLARYRVEHNDRLNAREINATITSATRVIKSQDIHA